MIENSTRWFRSDPEGLFQIAGETTGKWRGLGPNETGTPQSLPTLPLSSVSLFLHLHPLTRTVTISPISKPRI